MLPNNIIDSIFVRLSSFYGQQFIDKWKHTDIAITKAEWADALSEFDYLTIRNALDYCRENKPYPPSLPELFMLCKELKPIPTTVAIEHNRGGIPDKAKVQKYLVDIKEMLKQKRIG